MTNKISQKTILSGMRPTGELHLGHFEAVLRNWVRLQEEGNKCFYFIADWHALTTETDTRNLKEYTFEIVRDWLAFGINPEKSTIFVQSMVPEHAELNLALERLVNIGSLRRLPTFKSYLEHLAAERKVRNQEGKILDGEERLDTIANAEISVGFLTYPVLQAADILLYNTTHVPVGEDQLPHIELTRDLARTFNRTYGEVFVIPEAMLDPNIVLLRGTDGRKMSKSYGNDISPRGNAQEIAQKVKMYVTNRKRLADQGDSFQCPVYDLHRAFNSTGELDINKACREASIKCYDCKALLPNLISEAYGNYRTRRENITDNFVQDVLTVGNLRAREIAGAKVAEVKSFMLMNYLGNHK